MATKRGVSINLDKWTKLPTTGQAALYWKQWLRNHQMLSAKTGRATLNASKDWLPYVWIFIAFTSKKFLLKKWTLMRVCFKGIFLQYRIFVTHLVHVSVAVITIWPVYIYFSLVWPGSKFAQGCHCWLYKCPTHKMGFSHARLVHIHTGHIIITTTET